jgi:cytochrome P450
MNPAQMDDTIVPPMPPMPSDRIGGLALLSTLRRNAYSAFPRRCLEEPVTRFSAAGTAVIIACAPEANRHILSTKADAYSRLPAARRVLGTIVGDGLVVSEGEEWRRQRQTMAPAFTPRMMPILAPHAMRCIEGGCDRLEAVHATEIDLLEEMQAVSLEVGATTMFSLEAATFGAELRAMVSEFTSTVGRPFLSDFLLPDAVPTPVRIRRALFRRRWTKLIAAVIRMRREAGRAKTARDLFDLLSDAYGTGQEPLLADQVSTMIVAGHETTALALFWTCALLARAPDWQAALAAEAAGLDLSEEAAAATLPKLVVARAAVQEAMRIYPPAFMTARLADRSDEVCGVHVPKGAIVLMPLWLLHRHPAYWPEPNLFNPGRFLGKAEPDRFTYMPFGAGPHVCIGALLAMMEATLVIARLVRNSVIIRVDDRPVLPVGRLTTRPDHAPTFVLQPRSNASTRLTAAE